MTEWTNTDYWVAIVMSLMVAFVVYTLIVAFREGQRDAPEGQIDSLRQKAEQGYADAQFHLGHAYYFGKGVPQDHKEAAKWFRKAAEQGIADAQALLGGSYALGKGVPQDHTEAAKWYRKAAEQGHAGAQYALGNAYYHGQGVPKDSVLAYMWCNLAAYKLKGEVRENAAESRDLLAENMTREQIAEAQRLAREWAEKHRK